MEYKFLKCPNCGGAEFDAVGENELLCWYCGGKVILVFFVLVVIVVFIVTWLK